MTAPLSECTPRLARSRMQHPGGRGAERVPSSSNLDEVFTWGWNCNGQLGLGDVENRITPQTIPKLRKRHCVDMACGSRFTLALTPHGTVYSWGRWVGRGWGGSGRVVEEAV